MIEWINDRVALHELRPWTLNPRRLAKRAARRLLESWDSYGQVQLIVVGPDNEVYDGHQRLNALLSLHGPDYEVEVRRASRALTDEERRRLVILLHAGAVGQWDWDVLSSWDNNALSEWGFDEDVLASWKSDVAALAEMINAKNAGEVSEGNDTEPEIDKADELIKKWNVAIGQVWILGDHRLICGDSTNKDVVARVMGEDKATLVFTDPPYGVGIGAKNRLLDTLVKSRRVTEDIVGDNLSPADLREMLIPAFDIIRNLVMADDCSVFVTAPQGGDLGLTVLLAMQDAGLPVKHILVWAKNAPTFSLGRLDYDYQHEPILFTWGKKHKKIMNGPYKTSVWTVDRPRASPTHPTTKPVALVENALLNHTDRGDVCFDPFVGSGTTIIACENLGRRCRAVEIEPRYVAVSLERWSTHTGKQPHLDDAIVLTREQPK